MLLLNVDCLRYLFEKKKIEKYANFDREKFTPKNAYLNTYILLRISQKGITILV